MAGLGLVGSGVATASCRLQHPGATARGCAGTEKGKEASEPSCRGQKARVRGHGQGPAPAERSTQSSTDGSGR